MRKGDFSAKVYKRQKRPKKSPPKSPPKLVLVEKIVA